jgi:hypothetical protein
MVPQELMRDGGSEPHICRSLRPYHREGNCATFNFTRGKCMRKKQEGGKYKGMKKNSEDMQSE